MVSLSYGKFFFFNDDVRSDLMLVQCLPSLEAKPYLLEEEDTYEPPDDPDSGETLGFASTFRP